MNRVGDRAFKTIVDKWMKSQKKKGDGLPFIGWIFRPDIWRRITWVLFAKWMLKKETTADGRKIWRMPFRKALKRDNWEQSPEADVIAEQWNQIKKSGGNISFTNDSDNASIPDEEE
tara:strand:- start:112 stop:462 length:351 start_codon:yes stop_codon:yes gene_type:complete